MAQSLMDTGQVTWLREDGFRYRPNRNNISWMVCDMVEKPAKVAALMASLAGQTAGVVRPFSTSSCR
ncbi:23S rRNA methyltransferase [Enterobacter asburiae]|uniref:23S rRNA methyltransferase n=1 Tax=Enterobacter asburiae TaxID=61645 RepID=A0A376FD82_ENTAS|nr:23S rRNA methyltransferase [Enterobacter asburiae]